MRILFQHGRDAQIGDKPLAAIEELGEDERGGYYAGRLFDTAYNRDLIPGLKAGVYGASFRFGVRREEFDRNAKKSDYNPHGLPERTIREAVLMEFGPVTFPAYDSATAGVRSGSDQFIERLLADENVLARYIKRAGPDGAAKFLASLPALGRSDTTPDPEPLTGDEVEPEEEPVVDGSEDTPEDSVVADQTEGNRQKIAEALARFRHHTERTPSC